MARQSRCVRALVCLVVLLAAACGEDLGPRVPASIVIVPNEPKVPLNQTIQLMATVVDAAGRAMPEEPRTYTSDNPEIVTVSATGLLTAKDFLGSARITVASRGLTAGVFAQAVLPPNAITVAPTTLSLQPTEIFFLSVYVTDDASQLVAVTVTFSSSNTAVATVDGFGQITAVARGLATINVAAPGRESVEVEVVVAQVPTILAVSPTSIVLTPSAVQPLTAEVLDVFGAVVSDAVITFSSSAPAVASVSATGMVRGEADGSAVITIASGDFTKTVGVFVGDVPPGTVLQHVALDGGPWGLRVRGDRYLVAGSFGVLHAGQGTGFGFPQSIPVEGGGLLDVDVDQAGARAYVVPVFEDGIPGVGVVDLGSGELIDHRPAVGGESILAVALSPDESHVFVGTGATVQRINLITGVATLVLGVPGSVTAFSRHPTAPRLYGNMGYTSVVEIDSENGTVLRTFQQPAGEFWTVQGTAVSPDGTRLYAALEGGDLLTWDLGTGALGQRLTGGGGFGLAMSPDGELLFVGRGPEVLMIDRASLTLLKSIQVGGNVRRVGVRSDGVVLATNDNGGVDFIK